MDSTPLITTGVLVADLVVIWKIISGSLWMRFRSVSTNTLLLRSRRVNVKKATGIVENQKLVITTISMASKPKL
jgi:hypothetical protein